MSTELEAFVGVAATGSGSMTGSSGTRDVYAGRAATVAAMPFLLREYGAAFQKFTGDAIQALVPTHSELLRGVTIESSSGALGSVFQGSDGLDVHLEPTSVKAEHAVEVEAVQSCEIEVLIDQLDSTAKQIAGGQEAALVAVLQQVTEATGNVASVPGLTFEAFLESLEMMQWSLTDDDELSLPSLLVNPDDVDKFPPLTDEQTAQLEALKSRKHNELLAQRRHRRLS